MFCSIQLLWKYVIMGLFQQSKMSRMIILVSDRNIYDSVFFVLIFFMIPRAWKWKDGLFKSANQLLNKRILLGDKKSPAKVAALKLRGSILIVNLNGTTTLTPHLCLINRTGKYFHELLCPFFSGWVANELYSCLLEDRHPRRSVGISGWSVSQNIPNYWGAPAEKRVQPLFVSLRAWAEPVFGYISIVFYVR